MTDNDSDNDNDNENDNDNNTKVADSKNTQIPSCNLRETPQTLVYHLRTGDYGLISV